MIQNKLEYDILRNAMKTRGMRALPNGRTRGDLDPKAIDVDEVFMWFYTLLNNKRLLSTNGY